ncbi:tetratricopeptide repeat protein [Lysobacter korlensis]|uniref:Tetratricopeptide repeat protein n=1 Tax=Lysobacter korlensis TaxID=553636 RepID=A0ABV6RHL1_9GAMM
MYESIIDALRRGEAATAVAAARDAVAQQPRDPVAHRVLSSALQMSGDQAGAIAAIDAALALAPEDAEAHLERASLLISTPAVDEAEAALARSVGLDPNQFPSYILQGHLALGRGDLAEVQRLARTAARIAPKHPQVAALEGTLALRRGDADRALQVLTEAARAHPLEPTLIHALGHAYLAKGQLDNAERAFHVVLQFDPDSAPLRVFIARLAAQQGRFGQAAAVLKPALAAPDAAAELHRFAGELELQANRPAAALTHLKAALASLRDSRTLNALGEAWRRLRADEDARSTLDASLAEHPQDGDLWRARLLVETADPTRARAVAERWCAAMPDSLPALEAHMVTLDSSGHRDEAEALALRITQLEPGRLQPELYVIEMLLRTDPEAAIERINRLLQRAQDDAVRYALRQLLGRAFDAAGRPETALTTWIELQGELRARRPALPQPAPPVTELPALAPLPDPTPAVLLLWGAPGSLVERVAATLNAAGAPLLTDRYGAQPPQDGFQRYDTASELASGQLDGAQFISEWRGQLRARGIADANVFDWLLWWDNALLAALRLHLPEALVLIALRDPRDMLLDWLAYGISAPFALESPLAGARWLAEVLGQVAELHEADLFPHRLVRMDTIAEDPTAVAGVLSEALGIEIRAVAARAFGPPRFAPGHWREFADALAEPFALLSPVAQRLGYPTA